MSADNSNEYLQSSLDFDHIATLPEGGPVPNIVPEELRTWCIESLKDTTSFEFLLFCFDLINTIQLEFGQNDELQSLLLLDDAMFGVDNAIHNMNHVDIKLLRKIPVYKRIERSRLVPNQNRLRLLDGSAIELDIQLLSCLSRLSELQLFFLECFVLAFDNLNSTKFPMLSKILEIAKYDIPNFLQNEARGQLALINPTIRTAHLQNGLPSKLESLETPDQQLEHLEELHLRGILGMKFPVLPVASGFSKIIHLLIPNIIQQKVPLNEGFDKYQEIVELLEIANQLQQHGLFVANLEQAAAILEKEDILQEALLTSARCTADWLMYTLFLDGLRNINGIDYIVSTENIMQILYNNVLSSESMDIMEYLYNVSRLDLTQIFPKGDIEMLMDKLDLHSQLNQMIQSQNVDNIIISLKSIYSTVYNWLIVNREDVVRAVNNYLITIARTVQFFSTWEIPEDTIVLTEQELPLQNQVEPGYADMIFISGLCLPEGYDRSNLTLADIQRFITEETEVTLYEIKARIKKPPTKCPPAADLRQVGDYVDSLGRLKFPINKVVLLYPSVEKVEVFELDPDKCTQQRGEHEGRSAKKRRREAKEL
jgi:hypothetical protein